jgi:hypothetical protein
VNDKDFEPYKGVPLSDQDNEKVIVNRKTVAFFMLNTAIYLWFNEMDLVSQHLLAASVGNVLKGVGKSKKITSHVFNKETEKAVGKKLRLAMNFFKHADCDPNALLRFAPISTELFLIDATQMYSKIYDSSSPLMNTFRAWFMVMRGRHVQRREQTQIFLPDGVSIEEVVNLSRTKFMQKLLPLFEAYDAV